MNIAAMNIYIQVLCGPVFQTYCVLWPSHQQCLRVVDAPHPGVYISFQLIHTATMKLSITVIIPTLQMRKLRPKEIK